MGHRIAVHSRPRAHYPFGHLQESTQKNGSSGNENVCKDGLSDQDTNVREKVQAVKMVCSTEAGVFQSCHPNTV